MQFQNYMYANGKLIMQTSDTFLRINANKESSSGIWLGSTPVFMYTGVLYIGSQSGTGCIQLSATNGDATNRVQIDGNSGGTCYFNTGGNVGIGTTAPANVLNVRATTATTGLRVDAPNSGIDISGGDGLFTYINAYNASNAWGIAFQTAGVNRMTMNSGTLAIPALNIRTGPNSYNGNQGDLCLSRVSNGNTGAVFFGPGATYIFFDGSTFQFSPASSNLPSDVRLKQNIRPLEGGIEIINQLRPVEAEWSPLANHNDVGKRLVSIVAQELERVLPGAVGRQRGPIEGDEEFLNYNPTEILLQAVLAIQQMDRKIRDLEAQLKKDDNLKSI
jgi:hypothetical protein